MNASVRHLLCDHIGRDLLSGRSNPGCPVGPDHPGWSDRRSFAAVRSPCCGGIHFHFGRTDARHPVCRRALTGLARVDGMDCRCSQRGDDGSELDHAVACRTPTLWADHHSDPCAGGRGAFVLILRFTSPEACKHDTVLMRRAIRACRIIRRLKVCHAGLIGRYMRLCQCPG